MKNSHFDRTLQYSGTKNPDDAILFTVSGITAIVEQKFRKFRFFSKKNLIGSKQIRYFEANEVIKDLFYFQKIIVLIQDPHWHRYQ